MTVRLGLLRMDELPAPVRRVAGDYPALFAHLFRDHSVEWLDVAVHEGAAPASLADCDGWIFGGSRHSVNDEAGWIDTALELVREAVATERPAIGICFGHQLFARALGGRVERSPSGWSLGAQLYDTIRRPPWFTAAEPRLTLIASHRDQVVEPPPDAVVWSAAPACAVAGMTIGERAWSLQAHPEFTAAVSDALLERRRADAGEAAVEAARATLSRPLSNDAIASAVVGMVRGR